MLTGKRFRLKTATVGIEKVDDERVAVLVPADIIIEVTGGPRPSDMRMVDVLWEGKALVMFLEDVQNRGEDVTEQRMPTALGKRRRVFHIPTAPALLFSSQNPTKGPLPPFPP